jgi:hypothetical protein
MLARDQGRAAFATVGGRSHEQATSGPQDPWQSPKGPEDYGLSADAVGGTDTTEPAAAPAQDTSTGKTEKTESKTPAIYATPYV